MARRASFIKDQRLAKNNILVVDSGSALYATQEPMKSDQGKFTVHAMNMMGYDALNLGYRDLLLGKAVIEQRIAEANFAVLSANAEDMVTGELLALPYVIQMIEGHRVGIIGLTENPGPIPVNYEASKEIKITDPLEALRRYLPEVIETADVVILLSHLGLETDKAIAAEMPEIDAIIGGSSRNLVVPTRYEDLVPIIAQAGYQGEWIGVMNLTLDSQGKVMVFDGATASLTEKYADDPEMRKAVDRFLNH